MSIQYFALGEITKADRRDDGTLEFHAAKAAGPDLDLDEQILDPDWLRTAMPAWFQSGGNLREQHIPTSAAGVATNLTSTDDGSYLIDGLVVDAGTARKVDLGVLKGLSVGIKGPRIVKDATAPGGRVVDGTVVEVSLVDRPCNPTCKMALAKAADSGELVDVDTDGLEVVEVQVEVDGKRFVDLAKRDFSDAERSDMASSGEAMSGGGFPIRSVTDLRNAIRAIGRAKDPAAAKAHIKTRAAALGRSDLIPDAWKAAAPDDEFTHDAASIASVRNGLVALIKAELDELCDGENELCDVDELVCSLKYLMCWWDHEASEGETTDPFPKEDHDMDTPMSLGAVADLVKAAVTDDASDDDKALVADIAKALGVVTPDALKAALDADKAERAKHDADVVARLAKVEEMAAPGGPARMAPAEKAAQAAARDAKRAQVTYLRAQAEQVADRTLAAGYRAKAATLEAELQAG